jgi:autotransporter-associated beta strand protein
LVNEGGIYVQHAFGLGRTNAGTTVQNGASISFRGNVHVVQESLTVSGPGTDLGSLGAIDNCCGSNSWAGPIVLAGDTDIDVFTASYLNLRGPISGMGQLSKTGAGTLIFSGSSSNTYDGTTYVNFGRLELAKSIGSAAVPGDLSIGQGYVQVHPLAPQIANLSRVQIFSSGTLDLRVSEENIGSLQGSGLLDLNGGTLGTGFLGETNTFSGTIIGNGGNLQLVGGAMTLTGTNTHTGFTRVNNGTLFVDGFQPASPLEVNSGILGGTGVVGHLAVAGDLAPGRPPTLLDPFQHHLRCSNLTFTAAGDYFVELNGLNAEYHDRMLVRGSVSLGGARLRPTLGFAPAVGNSVTIINNDGTDPSPGPSPVSGRMRCSA